MEYDVKHVKTFRELMETSVEDYGERPAFLYKTADGNAGEVTYAEAYEDIKALATALLTVYKSPKIAVIGRNCREWASIYLAVTCVGGIIVPVDKELKAPEVNNILSVSEVDAVFYIDGSKSVIDECTYECERYSQNNYNELVAEGRKLLKNGDELYAKNKPDPDAAAVIVFTSGTLGLAKGVMLSQYNICSNIIGVRKQVMVTPEDRVLSVLPLHHTYECMSGFLTMLYSGASIAYLESLRKITSDMQLYKPTVFIVVPLILDALYKGIKKKIASSPSSRTAFGIGRAVAKIAGAFGINAKRVIYKKIYDTFGGKLNGFLVGAAPLAPELYRAYTELGFRVYCGYGLTETSPVCIMHNDFVRGADHVGKPISGVSVKLADINEDGVGELAVKGANVMLGYYKDLEATAAVIRDGWFYTGDLATVDKNGCYRIVGRCKTMIVTNNGKKIFPEEIEYKLSDVPFIAETLVYGSPDSSGDTEVTAEIYPNFEQVDQKLAEDGVTPAFPVYNDRVRTLIERAVKAVNSTSPAYKAIKRVIIRWKEFEKTTTKKIKRYKV